jgi:outer membrane protein OmpA-like peptidoglycan-associated protein
MNYPSISGRISFPFVLWGFCTLTSLSAQKSTAVVGTRTDAEYGNTTIIHTKPGISDAQVLKEVENDYSLGDEVRITVAPKPEPPKPVEKPVEYPKVLAAEKTIFNSGVAFPMKPGVTIRVSQLTFSKDAAIIEPPSYPYLDEIVQFLNKNPKLIIEIGGHTNMLPSHEYCLQLSTGRAKAVVDYLTSRGIQHERLRVRGYGKTQPISAAQTEAAHKLNQRVELKILKND